LGEKKALVEKRAKERSHRGMLGIGVINHYLLV